MNKNIHSLLSRANKLLRSNWGFPIVLGLIVILLTVLRISGSSVGDYQNYFYAGQHDSHLLLDHPASVRSDEFLTNTQMVIAQSKAGYPLVNKNIGNGENMSLVIDVPYKDWSELFKSQNWSFFVLPLEYAFAFKWWLMAYLLVISCYFFILTLMPERRLFAAAISLSILFSAFVQWWYQFITIAPIYYCFFIGTAFMHFLRQKSRRNKILLAALISYLVVSFTLVFYPPFQIACAIALAGLIFGELIVYYRDSGLTKLINLFKWLGGSLVVAMLFVGLFFVTRSGVIKTVNDTVYPGHRITKSGDFSVSHLLSGNLAFNLQSASKASNYRLYGVPTDQSEASNFILLTPFLLLPSFYLIYQDKKKSKKTDWPLVMVDIVFLLFMFELFVPQFTPISKIFLFQRIPLNRDLIGLGLLNIIQLALLVRNLAKKKSFENKLVIPYILLVFIIELVVGIHTHRNFPGFIGKYRVLLFSIPIPIIVYLLMKKYFRLAAIGFLLFSLLTCFHINPLYQGLAIITKNPVDQEVSQVAKQDPSAHWATEGIFLENFATLNGAHSLSGIYYYPQFSVWKNTTAQSDSFIYNRYAHVNFEFTTTGNPNSLNLTLLGGDHYQVTTNVCSSFLAKNKVKYLLTTTDLSGSTCAKQIRQASLPGGTFRVYKIS
jgi:hypothetical protein